jgi:hypothetical protein
VGAGRISRVSTICCSPDLADKSVDLLEVNSVRLPLPTYPIGEGEGRMQRLLGQDVLLRDNGIAPGDWLNDYR